MYRTPNIQQIMANINTIMREVILEGT